MRARASEARAATRAAHEWLLACTHWFFVARAWAKEVDEGRKTTDGWMQSAIEVVTEREEGGDERENDD